MSVDKEKLLEWAKAYVDYDALSKEAQEAFTNWKFSIPGILNKLEDINHFARQVAILVEKISKDVPDLTSDDKLDAAVIFFDDIVKLNFVLEMFDGMVFRMIISALVVEYNKLFGKKWLEANGWDK